MAYQKYKLLFVGGSMKEYRADEISKIVGGNLIGKGQIIISSVSSLKNATENDVTVIKNKKYIMEWRKTNSLVTVISKSMNLKPKIEGALIFVEDTNIAIIKVLKLFQLPRPNIKKKISEKATVDNSAIIEDNVAIGPGCYIGKNVYIGENTTLYPNVTVFDGAIIGKNTIIWSGTVIMDKCTIGYGCIIHPNVTIGGDGFGYHFSEEDDRLVRFPHIGSVKIGNDVEIGSSSCIDRGKYIDTIIGDGTKIDNLVQIGHNCLIGKHCVICGMCGISGSVQIGNYVTVAGAVGIKDNITIGDFVRIGGMSGVGKNIKPNTDVAGIPATESKKWYKQLKVLRRIARDTK